MITASSCREVSLSTTMLACSSTWCVPFPRDPPFYLILCTRSRFTLLSRARAFTSAFSRRQHLWDLLEFEDGRGGLSMSTSGPSPIPTLKQQCSIDFSTNLLVEFDFLIVSKKIWKNFEIFIRFLIYYISDILIKRLKCFVIKIWRNVKDNENFTCSKSLC